MVNIGRKETFSIYQKSVHDNAYRPSTNQIIWIGNGPYLHQHDVDIIDDHRIAIFNNNSINVVGNINIVKGYNEVNIYNFKTGEYSSYLKNSLKENDVRTITQGRSEILPNGDLFVEESNYARTLYFNSDGSLRWSHFNRAADGKLYRLGGREFCTQKMIFLL